MERERECQYDNRIVELLYDSMVVVLYYMIIILMKIELETLYAVKENRITPE